MKTFARCAAVPPGISGWARGSLLVSLAALCLTPSAALRAEPPAAEHRVERIATLWSVDTVAREIRLVTGTGLALRLLPAKVAPECQIKIAGASARLDDLEAGRIVRVRCLERGATLVAVLIETVEPAAERRGP